MKKNIANINIAEENKVLLSKIEKKVNFLSRKNDEFFMNAKTVRSKNIEEAYSVNEDLISILKHNDELIQTLKSDSQNIEEEHSKSLTQEYTFNFIEDEIITDKIKSTIEHKDDLIKSDDKYNALSKRKKYLKYRNSKRKALMNEAINDLKERANDKNILDIEPMKDDIQLIDNYIDIKQLNSNWIAIAFILTVAVVSILFIVGVITWIQ